VSGQSATGSDENKTKRGRLLEMRRRRYDSSLLGDANFMRRHSLAMFLIIANSRNPSHCWGFVFVSGSHASAFEILSASLVKLWILAKIAR